jgi:hypothetical protein
MVDGLLTFAAAGFPIILLLPLIWLVGSFLADSLRKGEPAEEKPPTRADHLRNAVIWFLITAWWGFLLFEEWQNASQGWIKPTILALVVGAGLIELIRSLRQVRALSVAGQPPRGV